MAGGGSSELLLWRGGANSITRLSCLSVEGLSTGSEGTCRVVGRAWVLISLGRDSALDAPRRWITRSDGLCTTARGGLSLRLEKARLSARLRLRLLLTWAGAPKALVTS